MVYKAGHFLICRGSEDNLWVPNLSQPIRDNHRHPGCQLGGFRQVMRYEDGCGRGVLQQCAELLEQMAAGRRIERGKWFVQKKQLRPQHQRPCEANPLRLSTRQLPCPPFGEMPNSESLEPERNFIPDLIC